MLPTLSSSVSGSTQGIQELGNDVEASEQSLNTETDALMDEMNMFNTDMTEANADVISEGQDALTVMPIPVTNFIYRIAERGENRLAVSGGPG